MRTSRFSCFSTFTNLRYPISSKNFPELRFLLDLRIWMWLVVIGTFSITSFSSNIGVYSSITTLKT